MESNRLNSLEECFIFILSYFKDDLEKTLLWFYIPNPLLGNVSPMSMIINGQTKKLIDFVSSAKEDDSL